MKIATNVEVADLNRAMAAKGEKPISYVVVENHGEDYAAIRGPVFNSRLSANSWAKAVLGSGEWKVLQRIDRTTTAKY